LLVPNTELLYIGGHGGWPNSFQRQASFFAPVEELADRKRVGHPGVPIADVRREEVDEALAGARASCGDRGR
jgi:hypothetical protein